MYIYEIQGLRVVAALLVAVYHIWFQRVSGGVDAFFVISGFFLYRTLFKATNLTVRDILDYYKKTFARIAPSACIIISATCALFIILDVDSLWATQIKSAIASMFFVENWRLAMTGTNYLAQGELASPFQQIWALSVQMQLYVLFPLALLALVRVKQKFFPRYSLLSITVFMAGLAFSYALIVTAQDQPFSYFNTFARIWEFLAGMILAMCLSRVILSLGMARVLGYAGLFILITFPAIIPVGQSFPGAAALVPVLATASIIVAASNSAGMTVLNASVMQFLGNLSFTFYLWHWPLLIAYRLTSGKNNVGLIGGLFIVAMAGILAFLTHKFAEQPFRRSVAAAPPLFSIGASALVMVPVAAVVGLWTLTYLDRRDTAYDAVAAFKSGEATYEMVPATIIAKSDVPDSYKNGCNQKYGSAEVLECVYGNRNGQTVVVLVGGSHSLQWLPALQEVARSESSLKIVTMTKGNCPLTLSTVDISLAETAVCLQWSQSVVERINEIKPKILITLLTSTRERDGQFGENIPNGFRMAWGALKDVPVLAIRDNARAPFDVVQCLDRRAGMCGFDLPAALMFESVAELELPNNIHALDLTDRICPNNFCPAVKNGILIYRDSSHFTATFARTFASDITAALIEIGVIK